MYNSEQIIALLNTSFENVALPQQPKGLYEPITYVLAVGGKRIRPVFLLLSYSIFKDDYQPALQAAMALETYHNYTLLHDDLMDRADMRRGKATVHRVWDDNTAILSGDTMLVLAYQWLLQCPLMRHEALALFTRTALEIGEGQQYDMLFEHRTDVTQAEYIEMIRLKTSVLVACATQMGAMLAGADETDAKALYCFGEQIGLAFQLQDDYLDVYGDSKTFGKKIGGDILCNKKTFLTINAWQRANATQRERLAFWFGQTETENPEQKIAEVTALYDELGIRALCHEVIDEFYGKAKECLARVQVPQERKNEIWNFAETLLHRAN